MSQQPLKVVSIGGGLGAVQVMRGLKSYTDHLTGVIAVTDTGRSTGIVREFAQIPAPGDIRNALATLAEEDSLMAQLMQHRIEAPGNAQLDGMAFGNIMIAALTQMTGSFSQAIEQMHAVLDVRVRILPVTMDNTHICAELVDGTIVEQEFNVRQLNKPEIKRIFIQNPDAQVNPACLEALAEADLITIGPGSLFTTTIACLAFRAVSDAIAASKAVKIYVCNTTTQPGQTDGYTLSDHVYQIVHYLGGGVLDYAIINASVPSPELMALYAKENVHILAPVDREIGKIQAMGVKAVLADIADTTSGKRELWQKQDTIRHNPRLIADLVMATYRAHRETSAVG
jgi:uncharacterized cofD-like protein